jgi:hypothetical protein
LTTRKRKPLPTRKTLSALLTRMAGAFHKITRKLSSDSVWRQI